jgi:hypothetical protein
MRGNEHPRRSKESRLCRAIDIAPQVGFLLGEQRDKRST